MNTGKPRFIVRPLDGRGFVIDAYWPRGLTETLVGVFGSRELAEEWTTCHATNYIDQRRALLSDTG